MQTKKVNGYILVEGEIGAGKTTMCHEIARATGWIEVKEPVADHPYLEEYYKRPKELAYITQKWTQHVRGGAMFTAGLNYRDRGLVSILDRGLPGDWAFAYANWKLGNMSEAEWNLYEEDLECFWKVHIPPTAIIHVDVDTPVLMQRIRKRGRGMEDGITAEYLELLKEGLSMSLTKYAERFNVPILRVSNNRWCLLEDLNYDVYQGDGKMVETPASKLHEHVEGRLMVCE